MHLNFYILYFILILLLLLLCKKQKLFLDFKLEKHKRYSSKTKSHYIGGIIFLPFIYYNYIQLYNDVFLFTFLSLIFLIGLLSDLKILNSVSLRFFLQLIFIFLFVQLLNLEIRSTKIEFLDNLLSNQLTNSFFVTFCLMVLINGSNFTDGLNGMILKYYILIYAVIIYKLSNLAFIDINLLTNLVLVLSIILFFNLTGFLYMGDSGAYLISLFTGIYLINFSYNSPSVSPYLIIVFLWYPCFELLFSMIRRRINAFKTYKPDTRHLHQLAHEFIKKTFNIENSLLSHSLTTTIINSYNLLIFIISIKYIFNSDVLIGIIITNIIIYLFIYNFLLKNILIKK